LTAQGLTFPVTYFWRRGAASVLHAIYSQDNRCGQIVINASQASIAKKLDPSLQDGSCANAGYAAPDGRGSRTMSGETFQVKYYLQSADFSVLHSVDAASARCGHTTIPTANVPAAKKNNPALRDGACESAGYSLGDASTDQVRCSSDGCEDVTIDYFLRNAGDSIIVHAVSDVSGMCGALPMNASLLPGAMGDWPRLQQGGCLANDYSMGRGTVRETLFGYTFDTSFFTITGRSTNTYAIKDGRCGQVMVRSDYLARAMKDSPGLKVGYCAQAGYMKFAGTGQETFEGETVDVLFYTE